MRHGYGPVTPGRRAGPLRCGLPDRRRARARARPGRTTGLDEAPAAPDLRPLRRSSIRCRWTTTPPMAGSRACGSALGLEPQAIVDAVEALGLARTRRRGLSDRHQVEHGAERAGGPEIRRLQRRRGRQRHLRRPHADGGRPLHAHRGHGRSRASPWARRRASSTCARNIRTPSARCPRRHRRRRAGGLARRRRCSARAGASTSRSGSAPEPISAARRPRCWRAWRASAGRCAPSRRCRR